MNLRLRELRIELGLNQEDFGKRLGVGKTAISKLEKGENNITDQMLKLICKEFSINEDWFKTGIGPKRIEFPQEDEFTRAAAEISRDNDQFVMQAVIEYWKLDKDSRDLLKNFLVHIVENAKNKE